MPLPLAMFVCPPVYAAFRTLEEGGVRVRGRGIEGTDASRTVHRSHAYTRSPNRAEKALTSRRGLFNFS